MLRSYLKIAYRTLKRHKGYAFINVFGLAVGLAACLLIGLYVLHELSYDRFLPNADHVYRIEHAPSAGNAGIPSAGQGLAYIFETQFPEVEHATEVFIPTSSLPVTLDGERHHLEDVVTADESFLDVFPYELLRGNPETVLANPHRMVLTQSAAQRLFGNRDPIGQTVRVRSEADYTVTGIVEDVPRNAHFRFEALLSLSEERRWERYDSDILWVGFGFFLYVELREGSDPGALEEKVAAYVKASDAPEYYRSRERFFVAKPVTAIHLHSDFEPDIAPQGDIRYLYVFSAIGLIILAIAVINYVNLATARSAGRAREVGMRKVVGAHRKQLVGQFLSEAALTSLAAVVLAVALAHLALPYANRLAGQALDMDALASVRGWLMALGVVLAVGLGAGLYPALFLSGFQPVRVLRGRGLVGGGGRRLRQALTTFQFVASIALVIGTLVVQFQLDYVRGKRLGFDKEQVVTLPASRLGGQYPAFKQAVQEHAAVQSVTSGPPMGVGSRSLPMPVMQDAGEPQFLHVFDVDHDYLETMRLGVSAGRPFRRDRADAEGAILLSEAATRLLGIAEDPLGETVDVQTREGVEERAVIGVIEAVHNASLHEPVQALALVLRPGPNRTALVRLAPGQVEAGLEALEATWRRFLPEYPFTFEFLDDRIEAQYRTERRTAGLFSLFSSLAVLIACLGLFGLAAFTAEQRTKEIGIRKVLGASVTSVAVLLSKDFVKLVLVAFALAALVAYLAMRRWLDGFAYRIELGPGVFLLAGGLALLVALATVSYQAVKAALADPVDSLRYE